MLGLVMTDYFYEQNPSRNVGFLAEESRRFICNTYLFKIANKLDLLADLKCAAGPANPKKIEEMLYDTCEALIGAIYKDGGLESARCFIITHFDLPPAPVAQEPDFPEPEHHQNTCEILKNCRTFRKRCQYKILIPPQEHEVIVKIADKTFASRNQRVSQHAKEVAAKQAYESLTGHTIKKEKAIQALENAYPTASYAIIRHEQRAECTASYNDVTETGTGKTVREANRNAAQKLYARMRHPAQKHEKAA